jgi:hypothetical protein
MKWRGFGRKRTCPNWGNILAFAIRDGEKSRKISVRITEIPAEFKPGTW